MLLIKGGVHNDPIAKAEYFSRYGKANATDIGDSGNTFPVPEILEDEIVAFAREKSVILQDATVVPMISEKEEVPVEGLTRVSTTWGNTTPEDNPTMGDIDLLAEELSAYSSVKNMTLSDSRIDIVSWITELMAEASGQAIDEEAFNGDNTNVCSGLFLKAGTTVTAVSATFASVTADNWSEMMGAKFYMSGAVQHYVRMLKDDNGRPIFIDSMAANMPSRLLGYPYQECIVCNATTGASKDV